MKVRGPLDLPDFRLWLMDRWRVGGEYTRLNDLNRRRPFSWDGNETAPFADPRVVRRSLPKAALWWVSGEMSALVDHASRTLPATTLTEDLLPDDDGLVVFDQPLAGMASDTGEELAIAAMCWSRVLVPEGGKDLDGLNTVPYRFIAKGDSAPTGLVPIGGPIEPDRVAVIEGKEFGVVYGPADEDDWMPAGMGHWIIGNDTDTPEPDGTERQTQSLSEDRRWLAALWLLASQPLAESHVEQAPRMAARRSKRAKVASDVRLVDLRRRATQRDGEPGPTGQSRGALSYRFIVGAEEGGFWRQQAYGPGWSQHRPIWIEPFVKGPKDKPLRIRETVKVVRGDQ